MCGISGFLDPKGSTTDEARGRALAMAGAIRHRGPDDHGLWVDERARVALAHRRLSVLELSAAGHQPMLSASGQLVMIFNGEIYNHQELRVELPGVSWRGEADTETLLECIERWGARRTLQRAVGMFALAVWDRRRLELTLARDRMGEKPLYWGWQRGVLLFASELKALRAHPAFEGEIDRAALAMQLQRGYVRSPRTIHKGIRKLLPGGMATIRLTDGAPRVEESAYWSLAGAYRDGRANPFRGTDAEAVEELRGLVSASVSLQRIADVPLGAFLSGGVDSSTVVSLMQAQSKRPVKTFTIGFDEAAYSEATHARAVAKHIGTEHLELTLTARDAMDVIPLLPAMYDEPLGDVSQIPTYLVSQLARREVTVALSGDGGDELFGGYPRYAHEPAVWQRVSALGPSIVRRGLGWSARGSLALLQAAHNGSGGLTRLTNRLAAYYPVLQARSVREFFAARSSQWPADRDIVIGAPAAAPDMTDTFLSMGVEDPAEYMMLVDGVTFLPDDVLVKVDRAAMAVSLETRAPLLDHRVVEFAMRLPVHMKVRQGETKWVLKQLLYTLVPRELVERPKMGFGVPIGEWLRGPLRDWAEGLLAGDRLRAEGFLNARHLRERWRQHLAGEANWEFTLWSALSFQAWLESVRAPNFGTEPLQRA